MVYVYWIPRLVLVSLLTMLPDSYHLYTEECQTSSRWRDWPHQMTMFLFLTAGKLSQYTDTDSGGRGFLYGYGKGDLYYYLEFAVMEGYY